MMINIISLVRFLRNLKRDIYKTSVAQVKFGNEVIAPLLIIKEKS